MLETQGQMKTPPDERNQEKENSRLQDLLLLLEDEILEFGSVQVTYKVLIEKCKIWIPKPKTIEKKIISPEIELLIAQGRSSELTVEQLVELDQYREPIN